MSLALYAAVGALTGLHASTWGAFKDSPFEGFRLTSFTRSIVLGVMSGLVVSLAGAVRPASGVLVAVGVCYTAERSGHRVVEDDPP